MKRITLLIAAVAALSLGMQAQEVKTGVLEVGDYTNAVDFYNGSYFDMAPTNFYLDHFASQMLYLYNTDFADFAGKQNVKITKIYFKFNDQMVFSDIMADVNYFLQEVDVDEFQIDGDGDKVYFECGEPTVSGEFYYEAFSAFGEDVEVEIDLTGAPFALTPGKNLLVTAVFDQTSDCMSSSDDAPFYTSGIGGRVMTYSDNFDSFLEYPNSSTYPKCSPSYSGGSTNSCLPVTRIEYTYTEGGVVSQRGDVDMDGNIGVADVTALISYLLGNEVEPFDAEAANCDLSSDGINVGDVTALIGFVLNGVW